jgi:hypothetical protein
MIMSRLAGGRIELPEVSQLFHPRQRKAPVHEYEVPVLRSHRHCSLAAASVPDRRLGGQTQDRSGAPKLPRGSRLGHGPRSRPARRRGWEVTRHSTARRASRYCWVSQEASVLVDPIVQHVLLEQTRMDHESTQQLLFIDAIGEPHRPLWGPMLARHFTKTRASKGVHPSGNAPMLRPWRTWLAATGCSPAGATFAPLSRPGVGVVAFGSSLSQK